MTIVSLMVASLLVQWLLADPEVAVYDEGLTLYGAARVSAGQMPYRDFWTLYGPASFYVVGALFDVFGESVLTGRVFDAISRSAIVVLAYLLATRFVSRSLAVAAAFAGLLILIAAESYDAPIFPAFALLLATALLSLTATDGDRPRAWWFVVGVAVGATAAFRSDLGVYAALIAVIARLVRRRGSGTGVVPSLALLMVGAIVVVLPIAAFVFVHVPWSDLRYQLIDVPLGVYGSNRSLPFPSLDPIATLLRSRPAALMEKYIVYVPPVVGVAAIVHAVRLLRRFDPIAGAFIVLAALQWLMIVKGIVRVSLLHMTPALVISAVIIVVVIAGAPRPRTRTLLAGLMVAFGVLTAVDSDARLRPFDRLDDAIRFFARGLACEPTSIPRLRCMELDGERRAVLDFVERQTTDQQPIYVGPMRHDKVFVNNVELYFLAGRRAATKWHDVHPGVQTSRAIQAAMIGQFERAPPALLVLNDQFDRMTEPNASAISSGVFLLDEWIARHFVAVDRQRTYTVLAPRRGPS